MENREGDFMRTLKVEKDEEGMTLDHFTARRLPRLAKSIFLAYVNGGKIWVNGDPAKTGREVLRQRDTVGYAVDDRYFAKDENRKPVRIEIVYEDDRIIVANKPEGMLSHPDAKLREPDLLNILKHQKSATDGDLSLVNRLDFNTTGLILVAKDPEAARDLGEAMSNGWIRKFYRCLTYGYWEIPEAELHAFLLKDEASAVVRISQTPIPKSQEIVTKYRVLEEGNGLSLLEVELMTGKTHQIRAHFAALDHPVLGDPLYGQEIINRRYGVKRQALWASKLIFDIPNSDNRLAYLSQKAIEKDEKNWYSLMRK